MPAFNDFDFRKMIKETLQEARDEAKNVVFGDIDRDVKVLRRLLESGDEFGDAFGDTSFGDLKKILGDPGRVKDAVVGSALKVAAKTQTVLSVILNGSWSLISPFISAKYHKIHSRERTQMNMIRSKYPDVFKHADELFTDDAKLAAFLVNPVLMLGSVAAAAGADATMGLASALAAGDNHLVDEIKRLWNRVKQIPQERTSSVLSQHTKKQRDPYADLYSNESKLYEAPNEQRNIAKLLRSREFQQRLASTRVVQDIKASAEAVKNQTLNELIKFADQLKAVRTLNDIKDLDANIAKEVEQQLNKVVQTDLQKAEQVAVKKLREDSLNALIENITNEIEGLQKLRVPSSSDLISAYKKTLQRIKEN